MSPLGYPKVIPCTTYEHSFLIYAAENRQTDKQTDGRRRRF